MTDKAPHTTRIYFQNINSVRAKNNNKWKSILEYLKTSDCDITGLSETCANWQSRGLLHRFRSSTRPYFPTMCLTTTNTAREYSSRSAYLPGGCLQLAVGHWTGRLEKHLHDPRSLGRWCGQQYRLASNKSLIIITAYRVCKKNHNDDRSSSMSAYRQQYTALRAAGFSTPDPRLEFIKELTGFIKNLTNANTEHRDNNHDGRE
jgi:hypothetical protein